MYDANGAECTDDLGLLYPAPILGVNVWIASPPPTLWPCGCSRLKPLPSLVYGGLRRTTYEFVFGGCFLGRGDGASYVTRTENRLPLLMVLASSLTALGAGWLASIDDNVSNGWPGRRNPSLRRCIRCGGRLPLTIHSADPILARMQGTRDGRGQERPLPGRASDRECTAIGGTGEMKPETSCVERSSSYRIWLTT